MMSSAGFRTLAGMVFPSASLSRRRAFKRWHLPVLDLRLNPNYAQSVETARRARAEIAPTPNPRRRATDAVAARPNCRTAT